MADLREHLRALAAEQSGKIRDHYLAKMRATVAGAQLPSKERNEAAIERIVGSATPPETHVVMPATCTCQHQGECAYCRSLP